jgi:hypothetical protein
MAGYCIEQSGVTLYRMALLRISEQKDISTVGNLEQLIAAHEAAKAECDQAKAVYEECAALERQQLDLLRTLRREVMPDPIEVNNATVRAAAYQKRGYSLHDAWRNCERSVRDAASAIAEYKRKPAQLREALALAESAVAKDNAAGRVADLERMIRDVRRREAAAITNRDNIADALARVEMEIAAYG